MLTIIMEHHIVIVLTSCVSRLFLSLLFDSIASGIFALLLLPPSNTVISGLVMQAQHLIIQIQRAYID